MAITINTNVPSLVAQKALNNATTKMNTAMERMSTGYKINSSKDDAAGMAVSRKLDYKISSLGVAQSNAQMGASMLDTMEGIMGVVNDNLVRIRDLTEQAANGTYGTDSMKAMATEINTRLDEISRIANSAEFNGKKLINGDIKNDIKLQVGITSTDESQITLEHDLFQDCKATTLGVAHIADVEAWTDDDARGYLVDVDTAIARLTDATTKIGSKQAAITSAMNSAQVMETNLTASNSLIKDADIAKESSNYIKQQILQQTSASLLATANQAPAIASNLV